MLDYTVKCCALGTELLLVPQYPEDADADLIATIDDHAKSWYEEYLRDEVFYLSPEALDRGFRFHSTLEEAERGPYRFIRVLGTDLLCRHGKYFLNPQDALDHRMIDEALKVVIPVYDRNNLLAENKAEKVLAPKNITVESIND